VWSATRDTPGFSNQRALALIRVNAAVLMLLNRDETKPDDAAPRQVGTVPLLPSLARLVANLVADNFQKPPNTSHQQKPKRLKRQHG